MSEEKTISPEMAFTIISTLRDQIEIQKMRIRKLKQQKQQREDLLQQASVYVKINTEDYEDRTVSKAEKSEAKELLTKIDEVLK